MSVTASTRISPQVSAIISKLPILIVAAILVWLSLAVTASHVLSRSSPEKALQWWGWSAGARAAQSARLIEDVRDPKKIAEAKTLAVEALRREPGNALALRVAAMATALHDDERRADQLFRMAEKLSRRDLATQLWLIERSVANNDIDAALKHYDRALRTIPSARDTLLPILANASSEPEVAQGLARLMETRPPWWPLFTSRMIAQSSAPRTFVPILAALRLDPNSEAERATLIQAMRRLADAGEYSLAFDLYSSARGGEGSPHLLRDGTFDRSLRFPPFDWEFVDELEISAITQTIGSSHDPVLALTSQDGRSGVVAKQLLMLAAGDYALEAVVGEVPSEPISRPKISVACASRNGRELQSTSLPPAIGAEARLETNFKVPPAGCQAQWLLISVGSVLDHQVAAPWIDSIRIRQVTAD